MTAGTHMRFEIVISSQNQNLCLLLHICTVKTDLDMKWQELEEQLSEICNSKSQ